MSRADHDAMPSIRVGEQSPLLEVVTDSNLASIKVPGSIQGAEVTYGPRKLSKAEKLAKQKQKHDKNFRARCALIIALILTFLFMIGEIVGGYFAHSLAIMTDAAHLATDVGALLLSLFAMWLSERPKTSSLSFGFHRAEILGAVASVLMIWALTGVLVYEAIQRIIHPGERIHGDWMTLIAAIGLVINIVDAVILGIGGASHGHSHGGGDDHGHSHGGEGENVNVRAAYLHVLGDCIQSIGVMIAGGLIWWKPEWQIADPIATFLFSILVLFTTIRLLRDSLGVLMESVPRGIRLSEVEADLKEIEGVTEVHDLHVWSLTVGKPALSVHITSSLPPATIINKANKMLKKTHKIKHTTVQVSGESCNSHVEGACNF